ncbi:MAG: glycoside hydrolase family 2 TIM barrel-domain containing protein [Planctomycetota bacterium]
MKQRVLTSFITICVLGVIVIVSIPFRVMAGQKKAGDAMADSIVPRLSPMPVSEAVVDLDGTWRFNSTSDIQVPGEWSMQGFRVKQGEAAHYQRHFTVPANWDDKRIKLRCDAVFSDAVISINGKQAGRHVGGYTAFELDVTALVKPGEENVIAMDVKNESPADTMCRGSFYAGHVLGGITRSIRLLALPTINLAALRVETVFDADFRDAVLTVEIEAANESATALSDLRVVLTLTAPDGRNVQLNPSQVPLTDALKGRVSIPVVAPIKWDNENPNLYTLTVHLEKSGKRLETVKQRVGFRQVEIRGTQMFVNGVPVKLRGINHHEVYPTSGRSVPKGVNRRDVELLREANVNLLRTSHYPPSAEFLEATDELGMFVECEAPIHYQDKKKFQKKLQKTPSIEALIYQQTAEMVVAYRNHPSIIFWSSANESPWGKEFINASEVLRQLDPTRPRTFNWWSPKIQTQDEAYYEIANMHYPNLRYNKGGGINGADRARKYDKRPVYSGEECHVPCYNRLELVTDPGIQNTWGQILREQWDKYYQTKNSLGMSIWAGVDDVFHFPNGDLAGFGTWGVIDGWRRKKPEWWHMKKGYSPVRILNRDNIAVSDGRMTVEVENRQNFSNLNAMKIVWKLGTASGTATADISPHEKGKLAISLSSPPASGDRLELTFTDPRGFVADQFSLPVLGLEAEPTPKPIAKQLPSTVTEVADGFTIQCGETIWQLSKLTGQIVTCNGRTAEGPRLMLLPTNKTRGRSHKRSRVKRKTPFTSPLDGWHCSDVSVKQEKTGVLATVRGTYDIAAGSYSLRFQNTGVEIAYDFTVNEEMKARQIGLVFALPHDCEIFSWRRDEGYWSVYPDDHIGRFKGTVKASEGFEATEAGPRKQPSHPWRLDNLPYGNNDFCSTKLNIVTASLKDAAGHGIEIDGQGKQHVRCWRTENAANVLIADHSNGIGEWYLAHFPPGPRLLNAGDSVKGTIRLGVFDFHE